MEKDTFLLQLGGFTVEEKELYEQQTKKRKGISKTAVVLILFAVIGLVCFYDTYYGKKMVQGFIETYMLINESDGSQTKEPNKVKEEYRKIMKIESDSKSIFAVFGKNFLQCTKDGVRFFEEIDVQKWNDTYTMKSPTMICEGEYTAVAEILGRLVVVYDKEGKKYEVSTEGSIIQMALNTNGYLAMITKNKTEYQTLIYNDKGAKIGGRIEQDKGVYPMAVELSNDNRIFAVSYLDTTDVEMVSKVFFFYINKSDAADWVDNMFASVEQSEEVVALLKFMDDGRLVAVTDTAIFAMNMAGIRLWSYPLTNQLDKINMDNPKNIVVAYGEELSGKEGKEIGTVEWISMDGSVNAVFEGGDTVTYLNTKNNTTVIGMGRHYYNVKNTGKVIWQHTASQDVSDILSIDNSTVLYVTRNTAEIADITNFDGSTVTGDTQESQGEPEVIKEETEPKTEKTPQTESPTQAEKTPETESPADNQKTPKPQEENKTAQQ